MRVKKILKLVGAIIICQGAGGIGSLFTTPKIAAWYASIVKPSIAPPNWVFGPVWTTLFLLMGISLYLVWEKGEVGKRKEVAISLFAGQLILNILWSALFFGLESPRFAFLEIIVLWLTILATIIVFFRISKLASILLIPYLLWVSFASVLNYLIWQLNL